MFILTLMPYCTFKSCKRSPNWRLNKSFGRQGEKVSRIGDHIGRNFGRNFEPCVKEEGEFIFWYLCSSSDPLVIDYQLCGASVPVDRICCHYPGNSSYSCSTLTSLVYSYIYSRWDGNKIQWTLSKVNILASAASKKFPLKREFGYWERNKWTLALQIFNNPKDLGFGVCFLSWASGLGDYKTCAILTLNKLSYLIYLLLSSYISQQCTHFTVWLSCCSASAPMCVNRYWRD